MFPRLCPRSFLSLVAVLIADWFIYQTDFQCYFCLTLFVCLSFTLTFQEILSAVVVDTMCSPKLYFCFHEEAATLARALQRCLSLSNLRSSLQCLNHHSKKVLPVEKVSNRDKSVDVQVVRHNPRISR